MVDLAIFGTNMIELIPWKTDDVAYSPMFTQDPGAMLAAVSAAVDKYGLQCGLWYVLLDVFACLRACVFTCKHMVGLRDWSIHR